LKIYDGPGASVELVGMEALNRRLAKIADAWEDAADQGTREVTEYVFELSQGRVAVVSGKLKASGSVIRLAKHQYAVVYTAPHARRVEYGFHGTDSLGRKYNQAGSGFLRSSYEEGRMIAMEKTAALINAATRSAA